MILCPTVCFLRVNEAVIAALGWDKKEESEREKKKVGYVGDLNAGASGYPAPPLSEANPLY